MLNILQKSISKFCTQQQQVPKSRKGLYAALFIVGIGAVNVYQIQKDYMSNIQLHSEQLQILKRDKKLQVKEQIYNTHPVNEQFKTNKPTIVIIGAGIIGLSQALKLLQHGNQVIVIEKEQFAATKCSAFNGNIYNPYLFNPLISKYSIKSMYNNYFNPNETATQRFSINSIYEPNGLIWLFNSLLLSITDLQFDTAIQHMTKLGRIQEAELEKIKQLGLLDNQLTAEGELSYYKSIEYGQRIRDSFKNAGIAHQEVSKFSEHPIDQKLAETFPFVIKLDRENNIDTKQLSMNTLKYCEKTYPNQFKILYGTEFKEFVLTFDQKVQGINTNKGIIFGNKFVICAGLHSKYIAKKLAVNLPIMPCRGWIIEAQLPEHAKGSVLDKMVLKLPTLSVTNLNGKLRISGCQSIDQEYKSSDPINEWGAKILIQQMKEHFNVELNETEISVRDCCRPLTPDDKMILCHIDSHNNVFVNAGHGSRGMSHCHACAEVIYQLMRGHTSQFAEFDISRFFFV